MKHFGAIALRLLCASSYAVSLACGAVTFTFSTGNPDGLLATASRPSTSTSIGIESADDFVLAGQTSITGASFTGLLPSNFNAADLQQVVVEIYRIFPRDSDLGRTSGAPTFSTAQVPTRVNSPSDVEFVSRDSAVAGQLSFSFTTLNPAFTASNSVQAGGIHPAPSTTTGGDGSVTGIEARFDVTFTAPIDLAADHYFFVPQVLLSSGDFLWLSAPKPIVVPGTAFAPDLQSWIRDDSLAPDWLRIGTDIVGGSTFNAVFSLSGEMTATQTTPEPGTLALLASCPLALLIARRRRRPARVSS